MLEVCCGVTNEREKDGGCKRLGRTLGQRGHMAHSCPLDNTPKPISIDDDSMLRKDDNGTSMVAIAKHPTTHTKALSKYVAPNLRGPKIIWRPSKSG